MPEKDIEDMLKLSPQELKEELAKLPPEERISKLKEIEKARKKQLDDAAKLINDSVTELETRLREPEEPEERAVHQRISPLESELEEKTILKKPEQPEEFKPDYAVSVYNELTEIAQNINNGDYQDMQRAADIYERIKENTRYQSQSETVKNIAEGSRRLMEEIFGEYKANIKYDP